MKNIFSSSSMSKSNNLHLKSKLYLAFFITILSTFCSLSFPAPAFSQKVLFSQNVEKDSVAPVWGPNREHFLALYFGLAGIVGKSEPGASLLYSHSSEFTVGLNYKRRLSNHEAIGFKLSYDLQSYRLNPNTKFDSVKTLLNSPAYSSVSSIQHSKEKQVFNSFSLAFYNRINFDKRRGNHLGHYLDLGVYGSWFFSVKHYTKDDINGTIVKTYMSHLPYTEDFGYGAFLNLGFNHFTIYSKYRISRLFKESYGLPSLPAYVLGISFLLTN